MRSTSLSHGGGKEEIVNGEVLSKKENYVFLSRKLNSWTTSERTREARTIEGRTGHFEK